MLEGISWAAKSLTTGGFAYTPGNLCLHGTTLTSSRFDSAGFILEHYVDGDLLDMNEPIHKNLAAPDNLHVWGKSTSVPILHFVKSYKLTVFRS